MGHEVSGGLRLNPEKPVIEFLGRSLQSQDHGVQENAALLEMNLLRARIDKLNRLGDSHPWLDSEAAFFENLSASSVFRGFVFIDASTRQKHAQRRFDNGHECVVVLDHGIDAWAHNVPLACHAAPENGNAIHMLLTHSG
jgi:hypothetical protein